MKKRQIMLFCLYIFLKENRYRSLYLKNYEETVIKMLPLVLLLVQYLEKTIQIYITINYHGGS